MKKLGLHLEWTKTLGGTKRGLYTMFETVVLIAREQDEIVSKINELEAHLQQKGQSDE